MPRDEEGRRDASALVRDPKVEERLKRLGGEVQALTQAVRDLLRNQASASAPFPAGRVIRGGAVRLSVVVPCMNEQEVIRETYRRLVAACESCVGSDFELVFVNDGSTEDTWGILKALAAADRRVVVVNLARNFGHQIALSAGLGICRGDRVLMIDADLQDPPELLSDMMALMDEGADVVYGQRAERKGEGWFKRASASLFYRVLARVAHVGIPRDTGDFRLINHAVLDAFLAMPEQHRFVRGMVAWLGFRQVAIRYVREPRFAGTTKYPLKKMVQFAVDAITGFSIVPLRFSVYLSAVFLGLAVLVTFYVIYSWLFLNIVAGWTSILLTVLIFFSVLLLSLGIIGEYVGRIYIQVKGRPLYLISEVCGSATEPASSDQVPGHGADEIR
jgi:glycosyltransferase involved in cell wall biosynthesis